MEASPAESSNVNAENDETKLNIKRTNDILAKIRDYNKFTIGDFLSTLLTCSSDLSESSRRMLSQWLAGTTRIGTRPIEIVEALYQHPWPFKSHPTGFGELVLPQLPKGTRSERSISFLPKLLPMDKSAGSTKYNSRKALNEYIATGALYLANREAKALELQLARGGGLSWKKLETFSLVEERQKMKTEAPVIWTILSVIGGTETVTMKPEQPDLDLESSDGGSSSESDTSDAGLPSTKDIDLGVMLSVYILMGYRNRLVGLFRPLIGVFLFASKTQKNAFRVFSRLKISPAHSTVLKSLKKLAASAKKRLKKIGQHTFGGTTDSGKPRPEDPNASPVPVDLHVPVDLPVPSEASQPTEDTNASFSSVDLPFTSKSSTSSDSTSSGSGSETDSDLGELGAFMFLFDNINKYVIPRSETVASKSKLKNGTVATLVLLEDVPEGAFKRAPYMANIASGQRRNLSLGELYSDIDQAHLAKAGSGAVMRILVNNIKSLKHLKRSVEKCFQDPDFCAQQRLPLCKSCIHPMGTSGINEATAQGASEVLDDLVEQMAIPPEAFDKNLVLVGGDQLTVDCIRKSVHYLEQEPSIYRQKSWALPVIQPWHMGWAYLKALMRTHWFEPTGKNTLGFRHSVGVLGRTPNLDAAHYYPCHDAVIAVFDVMVLSASHMILRRDYAAGPRNQETERTPHLLEDLEQWFSATGVLANCTLEQLKSLSSRVYDEYMTTSAYHSALSIPTDTTVSPNDFSNVLARNMVDLVNTVDSEGSGNKQPSKVALALARRRNLPSTSALPSSVLVGDQVLANGKLFMRDAFYFKEFVTAAREGDPGRMFKIMDIFCFAFWGSNSVNYGSELLEMACNFKYEYPDKLRKAIVNNYVVNPSGLPGHWQAGDLLQEHHNLEIKTIFNSKNSDFDNSFLRESVSLNISGFSHTRDSILELLGLAKTSQRHAAAKLQADSNVLGAYFENEGFFNVTPGRTQPYQAGDMIAVGYTRLENGALKAFLDRTLADPSDVAIEESNTLDQLPLPLNAEDSIDM